MGSEDQRALLAFIGYSVLAGGNAIGVKFSNFELDPFWGATLRFSLAALMMVGLMAVRRRPVPRGRALAGAIVYGLLAFGGAFAFLFYALVELEAGFAQIVLAIVPLVTLLLATAQGLERMKLRALAGSLLALAGVSVMTEASLANGVPIGSLLAALGGALCLSQASLTVRRFPKLDPVVLNAVGMVTGALFLAALSIASGDAIALPSRAETWWAMAYLVVVGSGIVFTLWSIALKLWDASRVNYGFVISPLVTVLVSSWLLGERLTLGLLGGGALVLLGVYIGALRSPDAQRAPS